MTCPVCGKPTEKKMRPFCSKRCADLDLSRWFDGTYAIPSHGPEDPEELEQGFEGTDDRSKSAIRH